MGRLQNSANRSVVAGMLLLTACIQGKEQSVRKATGENFAGVALASSSPPEYAPTELKLRASGLLDVETAVSGVQVGLVYATEENFVGKAMYGDLRRCFLVPEVSAKLGEALRLLRARFSDATFLVKDCARPQSVQLKMWETAVGTAAEPFVASPFGAGSVHNYGVAVDLTIVRKGKELDLGGRFDDFTELASADPVEEKRLLAEGKLKPEQLKNRLLLRDVMVNAGFQASVSEWWHFSEMSKIDASRKYRLLE